MRLLHTKTFELKEFFEDQIPEYVILSHRWGEGEVSYKEFRKGLNKDGAGYRKIMQCCAFARSHAREWVWIDTCCIDKRSSAELSEAINSMWSFYSNTRECYAYLADVPSLAHGMTSVLWRLQMSDWFTRGWTLQELLAPPSVLFCTREWEIIGTKERLINEISAATQILPHYILSPATHSGSQNGWQYDHTASVAEKMNWASRRRTTRAEDSVYCLLGLFGVSMPLLYGEGAQSAFGRLQLEILSKSDDETIFAWTAHATAGRRSSMLAPSPAAFGQYFPLRDLIGNLTVHDFEERAPYAITNKGLRFSATAKRALKSPGAVLPEGTFAVPLNCYYRASRRRYVVLLLSLSEVGGTQMRIRPDAGPEDLDELMRACQWEDVGLMEFYVR